MSIDRFADYQAARAIAEDRIIRLRDADPKDFAKEKASANLAVNICIHISKTLHVPKFQIPCERPSLVEAFRRLRDATGGAWDNIDVESYMQGIRGD